MDYLARAGQRAAAGFENTAAIQAFGDALALLAPEEVERCGDLLLQREAVYDLTGDREAQRADLEALAALAAAGQLPVDRAVVAMRRARCAEAIGDLALAIDEAAVAVELAQAAGRVDLEAKAQVEWSTALFRQSDHPAAAEHGRQALALARVAGQGGDRQAQETEANALKLLGNVSRRQGDLGAARAYYEQALAVFRANDDRVGESKCLNNLGLIFDDQGDIAAAQDCYEQALMMCRATGDRRTESGLLGNLGNTIWQQGNLAAARDYYEQSLVVAQATGDRQTEALFLSNLGCVYCNLGDLASAREALDQGLALARDTGNKRFEGNGLLYLADLCCSQGQLDQARDLAGQALVLAEQLHESEFMITSHCVCGQVALLGDEPEGAAQHFVAALAAVRQVGSPALQAEALAGLARANLALRNVAAARESLAQAMPILASNPSLTGADYPIRALQQIGQSWLDLGDPTGAEVITGSYQLLQERAALLPDDDARRRFLENVPENRELIALYETLQQGELTALPGAVEPTPVETPAVQVPPAHEAPLPVSEPPSTDAPALPSATLPDPSHVEPPQPAAVPSPAPPEQPPAPAVRLPAGSQTLAAQVAALLGQAARAQGVTLIILGDIHIQQIVVQCPLPPSGDQEDGATDQGE